MRERDVVWAASAAAIREAEREPLEREGEAALMDRAAAAVARRARELLADRGASLADSSIAILVGRGNNGGDALIAGAVLARDGATVTALLLSSSAHARGGELLGAAGGTIVAESDVEGRAGVIERADLVIDGIVGLGASPGLREPAASLVAAIPDRTPVLAVDLPSGLDADGAADDAPHVVAAATVSFTTPTACVLLPPAARSAGRVTVVDVGIPAPDPAPGAARRLTASGLAARWPVARPGDDKYSRGAVGVVAGSDPYPGAAILATTAAIRAGAGLVRYLGPRRVQDLVLGARPEVVAAEPGGELPRVDAWVLGPGVADDPVQDAAVVAALASGAPCVVDAGAIEAVVGARRKPTPDDDPGRILLTPHAGELRRALVIVGVDASREDIERHPVEHARTLAVAARATVLLKGAVTVVVPPEGGPWSVADAPPWLATAGAGDVLAGIAGALLATGLSADEAGAMAAAIHGRAAEIASGGGPIAALDVAEALERTAAALGEAIAAAL